MGEKERLTARLNSVQQGEKRTVYVFEDPSDPERELKFSAFMPGLPELQVGNTYDFAVEHVPMKDDPNKFYHNLVRVAGRDSAYDIKETTPLPNAPRTAQPARQTALQSGNQSAPNPKDKVPEIVWQMKDWGAMRGGLSHDAAAIVASLLPQIKGKLTNAEELRLAAKHAGELQIAITAQLVEAAEAVEAEKRAQFERERFGCEARTPEKQKSVEVPA